MTFIFSSIDRHSQKGYMGGLVCALEISVQARSQGDHLSGRLITKLITSVVSLCL